LGESGEPEVLLCPLALQVHFTVSPGWIVIDSGEKLKPPAPTVTVNVALLAAVGQSARSVAKIRTTPAMMGGEVRLPFPFSFFGQMLTSLHAQCIGYSLCELWPGMALSSGAP
jgi:hypothetical protein